MPKFGRYAPAKIKNTNIEDTTAPLIDVCESDFSLVYSLLIEYVRYTDKTPKVALFMTLKRFRKNPPKNVLIAFV